MQVTQIEGGTASNIVPVPCWFGWEIARAAGLRSASTLDRRLRRLRRARHACPRCARVAPESDIKIDDHQPACRPSPPTPASGHRPAGPEARRAERDLAVSYCTEAGLFQDGGAPAIICGPGDIAQAHTPNEFIARRRAGEVPRFPRPARRLGGGLGWGAPPPGGGREMRPRLGRRSLTSPEIQPPAKSLDASGGDVFSEKLTPTRNAIGLSSQVSRVADDGVGELSPWRSVLPPRGGGGGVSSRA